MKGSGGGGGSTEGQVRVKRSPLLLLLLLLLPEGKVSSRGSIGRREEKFSNFSLPPFGIFSVQYLRKGKGGSSYGREVEGGKGGEGRGREGSQM